MQLAIQPGDGSLVKDRGRVVELTCGNLGKPQNCRNRVTRKGCKCSAELTAFHVKRKIGRPCGIVRKASKYGLRATEDFHSLRFAPLNSFANELDGLHGTAGKKRSLVGGNFHEKSSLRQGCVDYEDGLT